MRLISTIARGLRRAGLAVARAVPPLARDMVGIAGACAIVYGVWQMHRPAAWIVGGAIMVVTAWRLARIAAGHPGDA